MSDNNAFLSFIINSSIVYGQITFLKTFGGNSSDRSYSIQQLPDSGYIVTGEKDGYNLNVKPYAFSKMLLMKLNKYGDTLWVKGFNQYSKQVGECIQITNDGGYIIAGKMLDTLTMSERQYLVKTNSKGDTIWTTVLGWNGDLESNIIQNRENKYFIYGAIVDSNSIVYPCLYKIDEYGNIRA